MILVVKCLTRIDQVNLLEILSLNLPEPLRLLLGLLRLSLLVLLLNLLVVLHELQ